MDPFIEAGDDWPDFHDKLISEIERELSAALPADYVIRIAKRTYIELSLADDESSVFVPDVAVAHRPQTRRKRGSRSRSGSGSVTLLEQPVRMRPPAEFEYREIYLEIYDRSTPRRLVTSVEILSPANKRRDSVGWNQYLQKRQVMLQGAANFIEIDLLRTGERMPMADPWPDSPYYLLVARKTQFDECLVWPAYSVRPMPEIPVPLLPGVREPILRLQPLIDEVYRRSRYDIDYAAKPQFPLSNDEVVLISGKKSPRRRS